MNRQSIILAIGAILVFSAGCRQTCSQGSGWTSSSTNRPCQLVGNGKPIGESCFDAVTGAPVPCPPPGSTMVIPNGGMPSGPMPQPMTLPNELPYPTPNIPPTSIPSAVPSAAPGFGSILNPNMTQPVKNVPNK